MRCREIYEKRRESRGKNFCGDKGGGEPGRSVVRVGVKGALFGALSLLLLCFAPF